MCCLIPYTIILGFKNPSTKSTKMLLTSENASIKNVLLFSHYSFGKLEGYQGMHYTVRVWYSLVIVCWGVFKFRSGTEGSLRKGRGQVVMLGAWLGDALKALDIQRWQCYVQHEDVSLEEFVSRVIINQSVRYWMKSKVRLPSKVVRSWRDEWYIG